MKKKLLFLFFVLFIVGFIVVLYIVYLHNGAYVQETIYNKKDINYKNASLLNDKGVDGPRF